MVSFASAKGCFFRKFQTRFIALHCKLDLRVTSLVSASSGEFSPEELLIVLFKRTEMRDVLLGKKVA